MIITNGLSWTISSTQGEVHRGPVGNAPLAERKALLGDGWPICPHCGEISFSANRRLLGVRQLSHNPIRPTQAFTAVGGVVLVECGQTQPLWCCDQMVSASSANAAGSRCCRRPGHTVDRRVQVNSPSDDFDVGLVHKTTDRRDRASRVVPRRSAAG
jgi:hypothetical protein